MIATIGETPIDILFYIYTEMLQKVTSNKYLLRKKEREREGEKSEGGVQEIEKAIG